jgi:hypothetical protein
MGNIPIGLKNRGSLSEEKIDERLHTIAGKIPEIKSGGRHFGHGWQTGVY